jgi:hypothetical protein
MGSAAGSDGDLLTALLTERFGPVAGLRAEARRPAPPLRAEPVDDQVTVARRRKILDDALRADQHFRPRCRVA